MSLDSALKTNFLSPQKSSNKMEVSTQLSDGPDSLNLNSHFEADPDDFSDLIEDRHFSDQESEYARYTCGNSNIQTKVKLQVLGREFSVNPHEYVQAEKILKKNFQPLNLLKRQLIELKMVVYQRLARSNPVFERKLKETIDSYTDYQLKEIGNLNLQQESSVD